MNTAKLGRKGCFQNFDTKLYLRNRQLKSESKTPFPTVNQLFFLPINVMVRLAIDSFLILLFSYESVPLPDKTLSHPILL